MPGPTTRKKTAGRGPGHGCLQCPQPRRAVAEVHDHGPAQLAPARDEQDQRCDEQQEFGERRRQEFQRRLHPVDLRQMERRQRVGTAEHALQLLPERERPVEHMHFLLQYGSQLRELAAPFHDGRGNEADRENSPGACRRHDQDGRDGARNPISLQEARRRRQHGADDEGHRDRQKEGLREIEPNDHNDDQQGDERKGHDFGAADDRRQFTLAVGQRRALRLVRKLAFAGRRFCRRRFGGRGLGGRGIGGHGLGGSDAHNGCPPPETAMTRQKPCRRRAELWRPNVVKDTRFHRGSVSGRA